MFALTACGFRLAALKSVSSGPFGGGPFGGGTNVLGKYDRWIIPGMHRRCRDITVRVLKNGEWSGGVWCATVPRHR